ncbi:MAG TPA: hypothetical protein VD996_12300 [Chitinophagaceae bacterium]|nr:hypothetical protein [Chitinophagaceae bacterium]
MKKNAVIYACLFLVLSSLSSCELIADIFKAGIWVGIILVVAIIILILWLIGKFRR